MCIIEHITQFCMFSLLSVFMIVYRYCSILDVYVTLIGISSSYHNCAAAIDHLSQYMFCFYIHGYALCAIMLSLNPWEICLLWRIQPSNRVGTMSENIL